MVGAERLLAMLPGVLSASIEGDIDGAADVRLLVEEDPPVSEILEAVRATLDADAAEFALGAFFHIRVASAGDESPRPQSKANEEPVAASPATPVNGRISLITHQVRDVSPGVIGVELTLGLVGHRFAGGASGQANSPGRNRVPALATLSALGSYIRFVSDGGGPTLALESVSEFSLDASRVSVVVVTMSGHSTPLIASWPLTGASGPAVVRATLEATARRVTRLSKGELRPSPETTEPAGVADSLGKLRKQAESLLESAGPIACARIVLDNERGFRVHVLATAEISKSEVLLMVTTLLEEDFGLRVRLDQITVAQSRLSREELDRLLRRTSSSTTPAAAADVTHSLQGAGPDASAAHVSRHALVDVHIVAKPGGSQEVGVRIVGGGGSFDGWRMAGGGGVAVLRPLAEATLDAVAALMRRGGRQVTLVLNDVRRFGKHGDDGVVVLVEAMVDGRKTLSSGAAFSASSFERASVVAVLQATNAFVAGVPLSHAVPRAPQPPRPMAGPATPRGPSSEKPPDSPKESGSPKASDPPKASASLKPSACDYVSQVLSRMQASGRLDPGPPR